MKYINISAKNSYTGFRAVSCARLSFVAVILILCYSLLFAGCSNSEDDRTAESLIRVADGFGGYMWAPFYAELDELGLERDKFYRNGEYISYSGEGRNILQGIDVSQFQGEIDWEKVHGDGVDFAMIRAGYRGYTEGLIYEDERFRENAEGASDAGIRVGVYFFSQATTPEEAAEEAEFLLGVIADYNISLPVVFDWETIGIEPARTDGVTGRGATECCLAFCDTIEKAGYEPGVYFYRRLGYYEYDLPRIANAGIRLWAAAIGDYPDFYYDHDIWQYSFTGKVAGIHTDVDLDLYFAD